MYLSEDLSRDKLTVEIRPATTHDYVDGVWTDNPDPLTSWLRLDAGVNMIHLRLTWPQLNALHAVLDALLTDRSVQEDAILRAAGSGDCPECRDALRGGPGHSDPPEVLPDRDPTVPVVEPPGADTLDWTIHGWRVTIRRGADGVIAVESIDGMTQRDLCDYPTWQTLADACDWLYGTLEQRPATAKS